MMLALSCRMRLFMQSSFLLLVLAPLIPAQTPQKEVSGPTVPAGSHANPELLQMVIADQWERGNDMFGKGLVRDPSTLDWKATAQHDTQRHKAVRDLSRSRKTEDC